MQYTVTDYKIVHDDTKEYPRNKPEDLTLENQVKNLISQGWQPQGGVFIAGASKFQAMVKYAELSSDTQ